MDQTVRQEPPLPDTRWRLGCFDLDGTLVVGTSTCQHLGNCFGHQEAIRKLEADYASGLITNRVVAEQDAKHFVGRSLSEIDEAMASIPLIAGIEEAFSYLRERQVELLLTTITWTFAARCIADRFRFDGYSGCSMNESVGVLGGLVECHFDERDKLKFVRQYCERRRIGIHEVFAVGDSRSDIPLFQAVGCSVALNATPAARSAANFSIDSDNLSDALKCVPGLL